MLLGLTACGMEKDDLDTAAVLIAELADAFLQETPEELPEDELEELPGQAPEETPVPPDLTLPEEDNAGAAPAPDPDGWYTAAEDVALYLHLYGTLPPNFITKSEARALGWKGGGLDGYADGKSIGGDRFDNYEGLLPDADWRECDINTMHASKRGAERIIYSSDGRIYYTDDHYKSFTLLYGEE